MPVNASTFRLVAGGLVLVLIAAVAGIIVLAALHDATPTILENLATGALTALAALLVSPHGDEPTPVTISDEPVQVTSKPKKGRRKKGEDVGYVSVWAVVLIVLVALVVIGVLR